MTQDLDLRHEARAADAEIVRRIVASTGAFTAEEQDIAVELVTTRLRDGAASGYEFVFAELGDVVHGYACFGRTPGTDATFDLYWIATAADYQGRGVGRRLLGAVEAAIAGLGGRRIYVDTSSRPDYAGTRDFYAACGYRVAAVLDDFYRPGDGKVIFCKVGAGVDGPTAAEPGSER
jgi:GNAT superfamily N-acetyltransferase